MCSTISIDAIKHSIEVHSWASASRVDAAGIGIPAFCIRYRSIPVPDWVRHRLFCSFHAHTAGDRKGHTQHVHTILAVERPKHCTGCGNGYTLHVHSVGWVRGHTLHVYIAVGGKVYIHPARPYQAAEMYAGVGGGEKDTQCTSKLQVVESDTPCTSIDSCWWFPH